MLRLFFIGLLLFFTVFSLSVKAQTSEDISELTPYSEWLEKKIEEYKNTNVKFIIKKSFVAKVKYFLKDKFTDAYKQINFNNNLEIKKLENGESIVSIAVKTNFSEVCFQDIGGKPTFRIRYFGRIISKEKKFDKVFEDFSTLSLELKELDLKELEKINSQSTYFKKSFKLPKGKYTFSFILSDWNCGLRGIKKFKLEIK